MTRNEIVDRIAAQRREEHCFIKSWGTGHKFVDFDLIDRFLQKAGPDDPIEGFELLDIEQMWQVLIELDPDKLARVRRGDGEVIEWVWRDRDGTEKKRVYPFSPEGIMTIIDDEFFA
jgi:hypothetical protein